MAASFFDDPDGTREEILAATYRALCEHGYADLTISRIGDVFEKSPSLVYHHYESKDELVLACLEFMLDRFEDQVTGEVADPLAELEAFLDWVLAPDIPPERRRFVAALVELRSRASHDEAYRRHFTRSDRVFETYLAELLRAGVDAGAIADCDPERTAATLVTTLVGAMCRRSTADEEAWLEDVRADLEATVLSPP